MTFALRLAATFLFLFTVSGVALAQSVTITKTERNDLEPGRDVKSINQKNCRDNQNIEVTLNVQNPGDALLEVWAGSSSGNCATDTNRNLANNTQCRRVLSEEATANVTVAFPIQSLLPAPESGTDICNQAAASITVWFLLIAGQVNTTQNAPTLVFSYDLAGPRPPSLTSIDPGEGSLQLEWSGSSSNDVAGYRIYCEPADPSEGDSTETPESTATGGTSGTSASSTEGGTGHDGGADGTAATTSTAGTTSSNEATCRGITTLRAGEVPDGRFERGSASQASGQGMATNLDNFTRYACGVAGYDDDGNVGVLSGMECASPQPVLDYFEAYRAAGGKAGGGYCRFGRAPGSGFALALGLTVLGFAARRAQRARSRTKQHQP